MNRPLDCVDPQSPVSSATKPGAKPPASSSFPRRISSPEAVLRSHGLHLHHKYAEGYPGKALLRRLRVRPTKSSTSHRFVPKSSSARIMQRSSPFRHHPPTGRLYVHLQKDDVVLGNESLARRPPDTRASAEFSLGRMLQIRGLRMKKEASASTTTKFEKLAGRARPKMIVAGEAPYSRIIDFEAHWPKPAKSVGALFFVDMATIAGLVAAGIHSQPRAARGYRLDDDAQNAARTARRLGPVQEAFARNWTS